MAGLDGSILSVGQLSAILKAAFGNPAFQNLWVVGEIVNKTVRNGHVYLDLADPDDTSLRRASIRGIIWASTAARIFVEYGVGDVITCKGNLDYYQGNGSVSLIISTLVMQKPKEGKALLAKRRLLAKLDAMGALAESRKRPLPRFVKRLAIVSSSEAAGFHDIVDTLARRYPTDECRLFPATVQGASAPDSIAAALAAAYAWQPDALIIGRGGGSKGDLSCFDDEKVALAILRSPCPVITAIGHQIDVSIADRLADRCAITPTDAANCINPSFAELEADCAAYAKSLALFMRRAIDSEGLFIMDCRNRLAGLLPVAKIGAMATRIATYKEALAGARKSYLAGAFTRLGQYRLALAGRTGLALQEATGSLESYRRLLASGSVAQALKRGFAVVTLNGKTVGRAALLKEADRVGIGFADGGVQAIVTGHEPKED